MRDADIRSSLTAQLRRMHSREPDTLIVEELGLCEGDARVDVAVINGFLHGFEIKSERDTLERLPGQVGVYSRALDFASVVVSGCYVDSVRKVVPAWWGIDVAMPGKRGRVRLEPVRAARANPAVEASAISRLLWREEVLHILEARDCQGVRRLPRRELWERLCVSVGLDELRQLVRERLKQRQGWRSDSRRGRGDATFRPSAT